MNQDREGQGKDIEMQMENVSSKEERRNKGGVKGHHEQVLITVGIIVESGKKLTVGGKGKTFVL